MKQKAPIHQFSDVAHSSCFLQHSYLSMQVIAQDDVQMLLTHRHNFILVAMSALFTRRLCRMTLCAWIKEGRKG